MTEYIVPMGTSQFFHVATPVTGAGYTWVGAYPYIDTADLGASYGEINNTITGDPGGQWVGYVIPAYTAPAGVTGARVDLQINMPTLDSVSHGWQWKLVCGDVTAPWDWSSHTYPPQLWVGTPSRIPTRSTPPMAPTTTSPRCWPRSPRET